MQEPQPAFRPVRLDELDTLSELAFRSKAWWGYDADFMEACRGELTLTAPFVEANPAFVMELGDRVAGFYVLEPLASGTSGIEISMFFMDPEFIGRGLGRQMIRDAICRSTDLGFRRIVVESDPNAERFYLAMGFTRLAQTPSSSIPDRALPFLEWNRRAGC